MKKSTHFYALTVGIWKNPTSTTQRKEPVSSTVKLSLKRWGPGGLTLACLYVGGSEAKHSAAKEWHKSHPLGTLMPLCLWSTRHQRKDLGLLLHVAEWQDPTNEHTRRQSALAHVTWRPKQGDPADEAVYKSPSTMSMMAPPWLLSDGFDFMLTKPVSTPDKNGWQLFWACIILYPS